MNYSKSKRILALLALLTGACAEMPFNAPIDDRTGARQQKKKSQSEQTALIPDAPGFYTVKKGDTLLKIAQQFSQNWRDIVDWNSLANPNDIKVGQSLRVAAREGAQAVSVPMESGMEIKPLDAKTAQATTQPSVIGSIKPAPLGNKVMYSDQAWADMQRSESIPAKSLDSVRKLSENLSAPGKFIWPTEGRVVSSFDPSRKGIDIAGQAGQPILAAGDGTVLYAKNMRGYGNLVILDHSEGVVSAYAHNKTLLVKEGQTVSRGQRIAEMGDSDSDTVKLHFEIRQLGKAVDPASFLPNR